jgi:putative tryptophan/tyrosine transport system substrate-binding protein
VKRREFITFLGSTAIALPLAARAQQPAKVPHVGILSPATNETAATLTAFREGIRDLGYIEGQTIVLDFRLSSGIMDALPTLAAELVRIPVNVIVTDSTSGTLAAFAATHTIPIVMGASGGDPVALGLAKSLSRPGFNVTGTFFLSGLSDKRLQLLKQAFPAAQRIAILANPTGAISVFEMPKAEMAASRIDLHLVSLAAVPAPPASESARDCHTPW